MSFVFPVRVYWEDTDAGGVVFYANYLKFMERARTEWLRSLGVAQGELRARTGGVFIVSDTQLAYRQPARLDDLLEVSAELESLGAASLIIAQHVRLANPGADGRDAAPLLCEGRIRIGWVDATTFRPARLPAELKGTLERFLSSMPQARTP